MARNSEKKMELFSKWTQFKKDAHSGITNKRPTIASECESVGEAEKWRREIVKDITKKIAAIHNASLGEHRIRELNDEINKLMGKKHHWEIRIRELGGSDFTRIKTGLYDVEGKALPGVPNYKYYGAAKDLPGVRELFAEEQEFFETQRSKRHKTDLYKDITPDYYGFRDDDDGTLAPKEQLMEVKLINEAIAEFNHKKAELETEVARSAGAFGRVELNEMIEEGEEDEINFLLSSTVRYSMIESSLNNQTDSRESETQESNFDSDLIEIRKRNLLSLIS